jgi:predicted Zn-ribbon and HTH transcriptional regulator
MMREIAGCTVIIYDQTCATEKRRRRKRGTMVDPAVRVVINEAVCEGCGVLIGDNVRVAGRDILCPDCKAQGRDDKPAPAIRQADML